MRDVELPGGPAPAVVRGFAACLASVTEVPVAALPPLSQDTTLAQAVASWKGWLAGRGFGLVPIADPPTFQWAGWWIAVVDTDGGTPHGGPQEQFAALAFGTPPGIVLSPQDPSLLGGATTDLRMSSAYAVSSLDPVLRPLQPAPAASGVVESIAITGDAEAPMQVVDGALALADRGLEGDRYARGAGTFSSRAARRPGFDLTLIAAEVVDELTAQDPSLDFASTRRNILTRGIDINALVGRDFKIGPVRCRGLRLAEPCAHLERLTGPGLLRPLIHRGGLRADVLSGGEIEIGSPITAVGHLSATDRGQHPGHRRR